MRRDDRMMEKFGKIDLHLHLDGSLSAETVLKLAQKGHVELPADTPEGLRPYLTAKYDCGSLYAVCGETGFVERIWKPCGLRPVIWKKA